MIGGTSSCPLVGGVKASAAARRHLRTVGAAWTVEVREDVLLATSELVANAAVHGGDDAVLFVRTTPRTIRVEVRDSGHHLAGSPLQQRTGPGDTLMHADDHLLDDSGRGLQIVAALSERWGVTRHPTGTSVWFEMSPSPPTP